MRLALAVLMTALALPAFAKLPPPSDEAKAKAAEAALKTAWSDKVAGFKLCKAMDRAAAAYQAAAKKAGKEPAVPVATPPVDPGAFVPPAATPPIEAAGAHSPATSTGAPPSTKATSAELKPAPKK